MSSEYLKLAMIMTGHPQKCPELNEYSREALMVHALELIDADNLSKLVVDGCGDRLVITLNNAMKAAYDQIFLGGKE